MGKKNVMISVDEDVHRLAQEARINVSAVAEDALQKKLLIKEDREIVPAMIEFGFEEKSMDSVKDILFVSAAVRAKRCQKCNQIWFVNDMKGEWKLCKECKYA